MKIITTVIASCFLLIAACLIYLFKSGVSIRTAPIIKPSIITEGEKSIVNGVFLRLFPEFQQDHYLLWGLPEDSSEAQTVLIELKKKYEEVLMRPVNTLDRGLTATPEDISNCANPCWIVLPQDKAHGAGLPSNLKDALNKTGKNYFSISWLSFNRDAEASEHCIQEKRLDLTCLKEVTVPQVRKKIKEEGKRYFFLRKYLDQDYFLFIEN